MHFISAKLLVVLISTAGVLIGCEPTDTAANDDERDSIDAGVDDTGVDAADDASEQQDTSDAEDAGADPYVEFTAPADGAEVDNPVLFEIEAGQVDEVEIFADETYSLGSGFDPSEQDELMYRFAGTDFERPVHVEGRVDGEKVARDDLKITVTPDSCAETFFLTEFDDINEDPSGELDMFTIREESLAAIKEEIETLQSCGADITLGAMLSLLSWEAAFRVGSYNTMCNENSYNNTESDCDEVAEALYSYQYGIGGIHASNFHPCRGGSYTQNMRALFHDIAEDQGYSIDESLVTSEQADRFATVCPDDTPEAIDHYILGAHEPYDIPRNDNGNKLSAVGTYPFLDAAVSVQLTFNILHSHCDSIDDDREAIEIWGGGDDRYGTEEHQDNILSHYENFKAANCD